ncbi:MAG: hypothetical protein NC299_11275 [Lachnospiraceae bacterium]|nr:hypothetical protein [Ruminococcus sp.]MCM1275926.1 hypothetical protein [Lachnospiraceae bacterium]
MKISGLLSKNKKSDADARRKAFARECGELTERLADIRANFDNVTDASSIDSLIFEENAVLCRLEKLYRDARAESVSVEPHERLKK